ncbi:unnamed protein product [Brassica oleracea]
MEQRFNSGMALHHRRYRNFCLHFPQQKPEKLLSPVSKRTQSDTGKGHPARTRNKTQTEARKPHIAWRNGVDGGGATERRSRIEASNLPYIDVRET